MLFAWLTRSGSGLRSETRLKLGSGRRIPGWLCGRFDLLHGDDVGSSWVVGRVAMLELPEETSRRAGMLGSNLTRDIRADGAPRVQPRPLVDHCCQGPLS